jgi:hypothetical protein
MPFTDELFAQVQVLRELGRTWLEVEQQLKVPVRTLQYNMSKGKPSLRKRASRKASSQVAKRRSIIRRIITKTVVAHEELPPSTRRNARVARTQVRQPNGSLDTCRRVLATQHGIQVSRTTMFNDVKASGIVCKRRPKGPGRYAGDEQKRLAFARGHLKLAREEGHKVLFVDEKMFDSRNTQQFFYCRSGSHVPAQEWERFPARVHVFGMIGVGVKRLVFLPDGANVTAESYLSKCMRPNLGLLRNGILLQDSAGAHKGVRGWLEQQGIRTILPAARSPDMNPIERLWAILQQRVSAEGPLTVAGLKRFVQREWDAMPQESVDRYCMSWERMLKAVIAKRGATSCKNLPKGKHA